MRTEQSDEIEIVYAQLQRQQCVRLPLTDGISARELLLDVLSRGLIVLSDDDAQQAPHALPIGIYGQIVEDGYRMQPGDRLEIYRPLVQDPMERRRKIARQNASSVSDRFSQK